MLNNNYIVACKVRKSQFIQYIFFFYQITNYITKVIQTTSRLKKYRKIIFCLVKNISCPSCIPLVHLRYFLSHLSVVLNDTGQIMFSVIGYKFYSCMFHSLFSSCFREVIFAYFHFCNYFWYLCGHDDRVTKNITLE